MTNNTVPKEIASIYDLFSVQRDGQAPITQGGTTHDKYDIPPFLRLPPKKSRERLEMMLDGMNRRFSWLAEQDIRPSSSAIARRAEIAKQLDDLSQSPEIVGAGGTA